MDRQYVYVVQSEALLSTESSHDIESIFANEDNAKECIKNAASFTIDSVKKYAEFHNGYDIEESSNFWQITDKGQLYYIRFFYDKIAVE